MMIDNTFPMGSEPYCPCCGEEVDEKDFAPYCPVDALCEEGGTNWKACRFCAAKLYAWDFDNDDDDGDGDYDIEPEPNPLMPSDLEPVT